VTVRAVLLDAVGTLIAPAEPIGETYARIARRHGLTISAWRIEDAFRRVVAATPTPVFPDAAIAEVPDRERAAWRGIVRATFRAADSAAKLDDFDACFDALFSAFAAPAAWRPRPGAEEALRALRADARTTAVVSNFDTRLHGILAGLGLRPLLDAVVLPADARAAKPDPAIYRFACARLELPPEACVAVGDDPERDHACARRAGLRVIDVGGLATLADLPVRIAAL
jgi:putative hydrolase of the HAD superfamily